MTYTQPLILICLAVTLAGLLRVRSAKGKPVALCGALGLLVISLPAVDWLFSRPLEARYPIRPFQAPPGIQAIVVLGSAIGPPHYERPYPLPDIETFRRCEHAAWIYRQCGRIPVLACQGQQAQRLAENDMCNLLSRAGVPAGLIWTETESGSTHENAEFGARILRLHGVKRIVLVVEAASMPRAAACFRREGMDVVEAPSEFRGFGPLTEELFPTWKAIRRNELTLHELLGLAWYRLHGWI